MRERIKPQQDPQIQIEPVISLVGPSKAYFEPTRDHFSVINADDVRTNDDRNNQAHNKQEQRLLLHSSGRRSGSLRPQGRIPGFFDNAGRTEGIVPRQAGRSGQEVQASYGRDRLGVCGATKQTLGRTYYCDRLEGHGATTPKGASPLIAEIYKQHIDSHFGHAWSGPRRTHISTPSLIALATVCIAAAWGAVTLAIHFGGAK